MGGDKVEMQKTRIRTLPGWVKQLGIWLPLIGIPVCLFSGIHMFHPLFWGILIVSFAVSIIYEIRNDALTKLQKRVVAVKLIAIWNLVAGWYIGILGHMDRLAGSIFFASVCAISVVLCLVYLANLSKKTDGRAAAVVTCLTIAVLLLYGVIMSLISAWGNGSLH